MILADRIAELSLLWKQAAVVFPYFDRLHMDWDGVYREYLEKIINAGDDREYCLLMAEFLNRLGDGHTGLTFSRDILDRNGYLPFSLTYVNGDWLIGGAEEGSEKYLLARVESINGEPLDVLLQRAFRYIYHVDDYAYPPALHKILPFFLRSSGNELRTSEGTMFFDLRESQPALVSYPQLHSAVPFEDVSAGKADIKLFEGGRLVIKLDDFLDPDAASSIRQAAAGRKISGVVLDMRENIGGMTKYGASVAELFISGQFSGCQKRMRAIRGIEVSSASQYLRMTPERIEQSIATGLCDREAVERSLQTAANCSYEEYTDSFGSPEHQAAFDQPCVLLTSRSTISAAEDFVAMFRSTGRAVIMGEPTHGSTGTPLILPLSCGSARICSIGYKLLDGTEFVGCGIMPDVPAPTTPDHLRTGRDELLDRALEMVLG